MHLCTPPAVHAALWCAAYHPLGGLLSAPWLVGLVHRHRHPACAPLARLQGSPHAHTPTHTPPPPCPLAPSLLPRTYSHRCGRLTGMATATPGHRYPRCCSRWSSRSHSSCSSTGALCRRSASRRSCTSSAKVCRCARAERDSESAPPRPRPRAPPDAPHHAPPARVSHPSSGSPRCRRRRAYATRSAPPGWMSATCRQGRRRRYLKTEA